MPNLLNKLLIVLSSQAQSVAVRDRQTILLGGDDYTISKAEIKFLRPIFNLLNLLGILHLIRILQNRNGIGRINEPTKQKGSQEIGSGSNED